MTPPDERNPYGVAEGQVWQAMDPRYKERTGRGRVVKIVRVALDYGVPSVRVVNLLSGRHSWIYLRRFGQDPANGFTKIADTLKEYNAAKKTKEVAR